MQLQARKTVLTRLTLKERRILHNILSTFHLKKSISPRKRLISFKTFFRMLTNEENALANQFLTIDPRIYGFKGEWYGMTELHKSLVRVKKYVDLSDGCHYLSVDVVCAFYAMNDAMRNDIQKVVYLESGYRSGAYQLFIFLQLFEKNNFNPRKTCRRVALPGWSEHCAFERQACDFTTTEIINGKKISFAKTEEYAWLNAHASTYGFYLSYPKNNKYGVMFEPWHWHYEKPMSSRK